MGITEILCFLILLTVIACVILLFVLLVQSRRTDMQAIKSDLINEWNHQQRESLHQLRNDLLTEIRLSRNETNNILQTTLKHSIDILTASQKQAFDMQDKRVAELNFSMTDRQNILQKSVSERLIQVEERFKAFTLQNEQSLDHIRTTVQNRLTAIQEDNARQLEQMRNTVDEKLQKTLNDRISQSFQMVNDRLEQVYKGLGEMQTLATGVGDLKKVLSNVKTRGIMGELQLGAILDQILSKEQYEENVITKPSTQNRVEFAIKLPGDEREKGYVYLPIDSKFPADAYTQLVDAYESGNTELINAAGAALEVRIKGCAKDISDKYIDPPHTTEFAIMFLPFEGLYSEVVRRGLIETLQKQYKVNIAGPTTMAALLNSLQMGFRTLAIQKRSSEVWGVLGAVKTEFEKFNKVLVSAQKNLDKTSHELEELIGARSKKICLRLRDVETLQSFESEKLIDAVVGTDVDDTDV